MATEFTFLCPLRNGVHARPASHLATLAAKFRSDCTLLNRRNGRTAAVKSVLSLIAADIRLSDECSVHVQGDDEHAAAQALEKFVEHQLVACDVPLPEISHHGVNGILPRSLRSKGLESFGGVPVSRGIGRGKVVIVSAAVVLPELDTRNAGPPQRELERAEQGMETVRTSILKKLAGEIPTTQRAILEAHLAMLADVSLTNQIFERIGQGKPAGTAILEAVEFFTALLRRSESPYIQERADDLHEICNRILNEIYGIRTSSIRLTEPSIVVADKLTPQQLLELERARIRAVVMESGGTTSHAVILARSLAIPTLVGVKNVTHLLSAGQEIIVDAHRGIVIPKLTAEVHRYYEHELISIEKRQATLRRTALAPASTADGRRIEVAANLSSAEELDPAFTNGADGIGLFRTEMLFAGREQPPSEEEQFEVYAQAARAARGRTVILRTFDVGADKSLPYFKLPAEDNPFLGCRGVRVYEEHRELLRAQMRAILRAAALGRVQMMIPMVAAREEVLWVKAQLAEVQRELTERQLAFDPAMPLGIMIEVPSIAFILDQLCEDVDFFSIGTNDLVQYFLAADRGNPRVARLTNVLHPAFLRFLKQIVDEVRKHRKPIGMCGEMAGDISNLPLLLGLGLDSISVASSEIPILKERISRLRVSECQTILSGALECKELAEIESLLAAGPSSSPVSSLLDGDLVVVDSKSETKEEAIREIINAFYAEGRTNNPDQLEEAVWTREQVYSTGLGHGFAIPHCKSDAVTTESIGVLKLSNPVNWGALDDQPVHMVILLAARESNANGRHMQVFSQLARKLMSETFRSQLEQAKDADAVLRHLRDELPIGEDAAVPF